MPLEKESNKVFRKPKKRIEMKTKAKRIHIQGRKKSNCIAL